MSLFSVVINDKFISNRTMEVRIESIRSKDSRLEEMFRIYVSEMADYLNKNKEKYKSVNPKEILDRYWKQYPIWPYFIFADGEVAGFCLLRQFPGESNTIDIDQFYVSKKFRRKGVGFNSLTELIKIHPGNWLIRVLKSNTSAFKFWVKAVENCVGSKYEARNEDDDMHYIRFFAKVN